jgi:Flp pilus assembly pilin Flp
MPLSTRIRTNRAFISGMRRRLRRLLRDDAGMSTVEYAIGCVAAAGFAALLYSVVTRATGAHSRLLTPACHLSGRRRGCGGPTAVRSRSRRRSRCAA